MDGDRGSLAWHAQSRLIVPLGPNFFLPNTQLLPRLVISMADEIDDTREVFIRSPGTVCYVAALDHTLRTPSPEPFIEVSLFLTLESGSSG
jgi:hypothetical protein